MFLLEHHCLDEQLRRDWCRICRASTLSFLLAYDTDFDYRTLIEYVIQERGSGIIYWIIGSDEGFTGAKIVAMVKYL